MPLLAPWYDFRDLGNPAARLFEALRDAGVSDSVVYVVAALIGCIGILTFVGATSIINIWIERRLIGRIHVRRGPNRVGPFGLLQPVADAIKLLTKEEYLKIAKSDLGRIVVLFIVPRKARLPERLKVLHMVVKDCNPLEDIKVLEDPENNLRLIMKDGVIYKNTRGLFYEPE